MSSKAEIKKPQIDLPALGSEGQRLLIAGINDVDDSKRETKNQPAYKLFICCSASHELRSPRRIIYTYPLSGFETFGAETQTNGVLGRKSSSRMITMRSSDLGSPETREVGRGEGRGGWRGRTAVEQRKEPLQHTSPCPPTQEEAVGEVAGWLNFSAV